MSRKQGDLVTGEKDSEHLPQEKQIDGEGPLSNRFLQNLKSEILERLHLMSVHIYKYKVIFHSFQSPEI